MTFKERFLVSLISKNKISPSITVEQSLPFATNTSDSIKEHLLYMDAIGRITYAYPFHYTASQLDNYCVLYTISGKGEFLFTNETIHPLTAGTLLFFNCQEAHELKATSSSWEVFQIFLNGNSLPYYYKTYFERHGSTIELLQTSVIPSLLSQLEERKKDSSEKNAMLNHKTLTDLLTVLVLEQSHAETVFIPNYLRKIKKELDTHYHIQYTLDMLETQFHVSKYRIARDFKKHYGESPIHYLNQQRIMQAKKLLQQSDIPIHQIGRSIGIDNPTYFIQLFKRQTALTPAAYRKQHHIYHNHLDE